jgi:hypothetical protein
MGVEAANCQIRYEEVISRGRIDSALEVLGAEIVPDGGSAMKAAVASDKFWIDLQVWWEQPVVSVRVALCNPPDVVAMLRTVLSTFVVLSPAVVVDMDGDAQYSVL